MTTPTTLPHLCTERTPLLPINEHEEQTASQAEVAPVQSLLPPPEELQEELVAPLQPFDFFVDPQSLIAPPSPGVVDEENGLELGDSNASPTTMGRITRRPSKRGHRHRRSPTWSHSYRFESSILEEILGEREGEESVALEALFEFATNGDLPLEVDDLIVATVLIVAEETDYGDLKWSLLSNTFFILGGCVEMASALWELLLQGGEDKNQVMAFIHVAVGIVGPLIYLLESIVDITWTLRVQKREERRDQLAGLDIDLVAPHKEAELVEVKTGHKGETKTVLRLPFEPQNVARRVRHYVGHRRALAAAISFGIGAFCELSSAYLCQFNTDLYNEIGAFLDKSAINGYLASALISLWGCCGADDIRKEKAWMHVWTDASRLESLGDRFFGCEAVLDTFICYLSLDATVLWWDVLSASLWLIDALCYLRADVISMKEYKPNHPLGHRRAGSGGSATSDCSSNSDATRGYQNKSLNRTESPLDLDDCPNIVPLNRR